MELDDVVDDHPVAKLGLQFLLAIQAGLLLWVAIEFSVDPSLDDIVPALFAFLTAAVVSMTLGYRRTAITAGISAGIVAAILMSTLPGWATFASAGILLAALAIVFRLWQHAKQRTRQLLLDRVAGVADVSQPFRSGAA